MKQVGPGAEVEEGEDWNIARRYFMRPMCLDHSNSDSDGEETQGGDIQSTPIDPRPTYEVHVEQMDSKAGWTQQQISKKKN